MSEDRMNQIIGTIQPMIDIHRGATDEKLAITAAAANVLGSVRMGLRENDIITSEAEKILILFNEAAGYSFSIDFQTGNIIYPPELVSVE